MRFVRGFFALILLGIVVVLAFYATFRYRSAPGREIVLGKRDPLVFDDFAFTVVGQRYEELAVPGATGLRRAFLVELDVENRAKSVSFTFRHEVGRVIGDDGREFAVSPDLQNLLRSAGRAGCEHEIAPGVASKALLAFDLPADLRPRWFKLEFADQPFSAIDVVVYGERRIPLEP